MANPQTTIPSEGVTLNFPAVPQSPPQEPSQEGQRPVQETVIVPTGYNPEPQVQAPSGQNNSVNPGKSGRRGCLSMFPILIIIVIILGALGFGAWYLRGNITSGGQVTIVYWGLWENDAIIAPAISDFEAANPNIKVEYVKQNHKQYRERLTAAIDRGEGPDVFRFHNTWVAMLRDNLSPVPKEIMTPEEFSAAFYPVAKNDLVGGTTIYGLPMEIDGLGLYINEDLFTAAGVSVPTTWEDVLSIVPQLTVKDEQTITTSAIALGTTSNVEHWSDILAVLMMQNGAQLANPTGKNAEDALMFFMRFSNPSDEVYTWNANMDNSVSAFADDRLAMMLAPSWRVFDVKQINPDANFRIVPIPQLPGSTVNWASYWVEGVSSKSKNKEAAWKLVSYLTDRDGMIKVYTSAANTRLFGEPYSRKDLSGNLAGDPYVEAYVKQAETAQSFPLASRTFDNGLNDQMIKYLEDAVNGLSSGGSPTSVLTTAANGFQQVLSRYGLVSAAAPPGQ